MRELHDRAADAGQGFGDQLKGKATQAGSVAAAAVEQVRSTATDTASAAESAVDQGLDRAADAVTGAADILRRQADRLPGDTTADLARQAAGNLAQGADYLRETDVAGMRGNLKSLIRRYPTQSLAVGLVLGFAIAWYLRR